MFLGLRLGRSELGQASRLGPRLLPAAPRWKVGKSIDPAVPVKRSSSNADAGATGASQSSLAVLVRRGCCSLNP